MDALFLKKAQGQYDLDHSDTLVYQVRVIYLWAQRAILAFLFLVRGQESKDMIHTRL